MSPADYYTHPNSLSSQLARWDRWRKNRPSVTFSISDIVGFQQGDNLRECKTSEDIMALAKAEGYELTDDELQQITGGSDGYVVGGSIWGDGPQYVAWCPHCGQQYYFMDPDDPVDWCPHCAAKLR